jgi:hypothetical protein
VDGEAFLRVSGAEKKIQRLCAAFLGVRVPKDASLSTSKFFTKVMDCREFACAQEAKASDSGGLFAAAEGVADPEAGPSKKRRLRRVEQRQVRSNRKIVTIAPTQDAARFRVLTVAHRQDTLHVAVADVALFLEAMKAFGVEDEDWRKREKQSFKGVPAAKRLMKMGGGRLARRGADGRLQYVTKKPASKAAAKAAAQAASSESADASASESD